MTSDVYKSRLSLASERLYHSCDLSKLDFESTLDIVPTIEHLGQVRAMDALKFGIGMKHDGYNLYVLGSTGLGKHTTVKKILDKESEKSSTPGDWCYVNNFEQHHNPHCLKLPSGRAGQLKSHMDNLIDDILAAIPAAFESDEYQNRSQSIYDEFKEREEKTFQELSEKADKKNIVMLRTPGGYTLGPTKNGEILTPENFDKLTEQEQDKIKNDINHIEEELKNIIHLLPVWQKERRDKLKQLNREFSKLTVDQFVDSVKSSYQDLPEVIKYINTVQKDIINNVDVFRKYGEEIKSGTNNHDAIKLALAIYQVNVLVDNSNTEGAPVIYEDNPTYLNLLGRIEHIAQLGTLLTNFTLIKSGALHRANGGYLILDIRKLLMSPFAWEGLKRVLHSGEVRIESLEQMLSLASTTSLQPEPIPIDIKVILTGSRLIYYLLKEYDPEFGLLFKVAADFSEDISWNDENTELYAQLITSLQKENQLSHIEKKGVERIIEHCARMIDDGEKISLHMGNLLDLLRESDYWAKQEGHKQILDNDVQKAIDTRNYRVDQIRERVHEQVLRGNYLLDTEGEKIAQVNGLSIFQIGDYAFGRPSRITATARLGSGKVIDIEREVELGGAIHSKGVLILSSYLATHYAKDQPLALSATLVFEQSYGMVDGDSASAAELCALISALSEIPIKQSIAITGSVNQRGDIQAIGGVNEKIEGFYDICNARGLTGNQAVIIPDSNIKHLMLRKDIRDAVDKKQFAIYAVNTIDEVIQLLTDKEAGEPDSKGQYPKDSVNWYVQQRLQRLKKLHKQYSQSDGDKNHAGKKQT
ncbi:MAG: Lon protease family protein [Gammaproteobacteria bacterium]